MIDLQARPFNLDEPAREWVRTTLEGLTDREKVGQLFCEILWDPERTDPTELFREAVMCRPFDGTRMNQVSHLLQGRSKVPLLIAANLERGGNGARSDGTYFATPMAVAATDDPLHAYRSGIVAAREAEAVGINWTFGPIVDIDINPENPITNVRTYGSDADRVISMAQGYMDGFTEHGMAVAVKHFTGDGIDFRDQHLLASINSLSSQDWHASFGRVYQSLIDHGALAVMSAHIKQPALTRDITPEAKDEDILPASLSSELNLGILRGRLNFNGVAVTDATLMAGFTSAMERRAAVPAAIANGCDMFLFTINQKEDVQYMMDGVSEGTISTDRLDEAVTRIFAMKAALGLHIKQASGTLVPAPESVDAMPKDRHRAWARECADRAVTLVKDQKGILPVTPKKFKRIMIIPVTNQEPGVGHPAELEQFKASLERAGHQNRYFQASQVPGSGQTVASYRTETDLIIYVANVNVRSNQTSLRVAWSAARAADCAMYVSEIPTMFISFSSPCPSRPSLHPAVDGRRPSPQPGPAKGPPARRGKP